MRAFLLLWLGQVVSLSGSITSHFALGIWVYGQTGSATGFALIATCEILPVLLLSPLAGVVADRHDRRRVMLLSDAASAAATLAIAALWLTGRLQLLHVYLAVTAAAAAGAFQRPAYLAAVQQLIPPRHLGRASGMIGLGQSLGDILAPALGGALLGLVGLGGILLVDVATFAFAVLTQLLVRVPPVARAGEGRPGAGGLWREGREGIRHILARPALMGLMAFSAAMNVSIGMTTVLVPPLLLKLTSASALGFVVSATGAGGLLGGALMSVWGGPRRKVLGVCGFGLLFGASLLVAGARPLVWLIGLGGFCLILSFPLIMGCNQAIWLAKVPPAVQGRVQGVRNAVAGVTLLLTYAAAGPLADRVFEPLLLEGGALAGSAGRLIGVGPGRGSALIFICLGALTILAALAFLHPRLRRMEEELPDWRAEAEAEPAPSATGSLA